MDMQQVNVEGLFNALKTKGKAKLSDFAEPVSETNNNSINNQNETTMNENVKAADLIGKKIVINGTDKYYKVLGVDGDKLLTEFHIGEGKDPMSVPLPMANLKGFLEKNVWSIEGEAPKAEPKGDDDVQEVEDVQPEKHEPKPDVKPKAKEQKAKAEKKAETKPKAEPKPKTEKPKSKKAKHEVKATGKLTYETYTSNRGKQCARILGFTADHPAYTNAAEIHGSASWNTTDEGRVLYIAFGPRYVERAKRLLDALNSGKSFEHCKDIIEGKYAATDAPSGEKTYTLDEVAAMLKKLLPEGDKASIEDIKALLEVA